MEMCYDGILVMPSNYAVMDEEDRMYLEGGRTFTLKMNKECCLDTYYDIYMESIK